MSRRKKITAFAIGAALNTPFFAVIILLGG